MVAGLVDKNHDAKANLMDAVNRGFSFDNIKSIVKLYVEHHFLDEREADTFLQLYLSVLQVMRKLKKLQTSY